MLQLIDCLYKELVAMSGKDAGKTSINSRFGSFVRVFSLGTQLGLNVFS